MQLLDGWAFATRSDVLARATENLRIPESDDVARLVGWVFGEVESLDAASAPSEAEWDRIVLERTVGMKGSEEQRLIAAYYLLSRLGEELRRREVQAWRNTNWAPDERDAETREVWEGLLGEPASFDAVARFKELFGDAIKRAFSGVDLVLQMPGEVAEAHREQALEQLDLLGIGAHLDLATRVIETRDEPVRALAAALTGPGFEKLKLCAKSREGWAKAWAFFGREVEDGELGFYLSEGSELALFLRMVDHLREGSAPPHHLGLPGWGILSTNRNRIRGRLRALVKEEVAPLRRLLLDTPSLYNRTLSAVSRHAWEWAWREARSGFSFSPDKIASPACALPAENRQAVAELGPEDDKALISFLQLTVGRGCWKDMERWLQGAPSRSLSKTFYRCLRQVPDRLADPMQENQRVRRYSRLWGHLADGGVEQYLPRLHMVADRVKRIQPDRSLKKKLHETLKLDWDVQEVPLPDHHLPSFLRAFSEFADGVSKSTTGGRG